MIVQQKRKTKRRKLMGINKLTPTTDARLDSINGWLIKEDTCSTCGGANFSEPPSYNYEAYEQVICPACEGVDWASYP